MKKPRMYGTLGGLAALVLAFLFVAFPFHIMAPLEIQARDAETVYVAVPGKLEKVYVQPGDRVKKDQRLARLSSIDLEHEIKQREGERDLYKTQLESLFKGLRFDDPRANAEIPGVQKKLRTAEELLERLYEKMRDLELKAPADGVVLPPPWVPNREDPEGRLPSWFGTPLLPRNLGCYLEQGTKFCLIGDPKKKEAVLVIDQADVDFVQPRQNAEIKLDELPQETFLSVVAEIAPDAMQFVSKRLATTGGGDVPAEADPSGVERPMNPSYQASVHLGECYSFNLEYDRLQGRLENSQTEQSWKLRYLASGEPADSYGGCLVLSGEAAPLLAEYKPGDFVEVEGRLSSNSPPVYEIRSIKPQQDFSQLLRIGLRGQAKVEVAPQTLGRRFWRFLTRTFNFKL